MDVKTEVWAIVCDERTPMSHSAKSITQRVYSISGEPRATESKNVLHALHALESEGLIESRGVSGSPQKLEWFSRDKIRAIIG